MPSRKLQKQTNSCQSNQYWRTASWLAHVGVTSKHGLKMKPFNGVSYTQSWIQGQFVEDDTSEKHINLLHNLLLKCTECSQKTPTQNP